MKNFAVTYITFLLFSVYHIFPGIVIPSEKL